ncbi:hypothetical protein [Kitasatospora cineracea]|uniref:hypothetical protein n=1 Tax=Kitasatospora cineracea TaxID=88074 RepID=UPI0033F93C86
MYDRPSLGQANLPEVISHASRAKTASTGFRGLRAAHGRLQLDALLAVFALAWAMFVDRAIEWERVALILGLLRVCRATGVDWFWARRA